MQVMDPTLSEQASMKTRASRGQTAPSRIFNSRDPRRVLDDIRQYISNRAGNWNPSKQEEEANKIYNIKKEMAKLISEGRIKVYENGYGISSKPRSLISKLLPSYFLKSPKLTQSGDLEIDQNTKALKALEAFMKDGGQEDGFFNIYYMISGTDAPSVLTISERKEYAKLEADLANELDRILELGNYMDLSSKRDPFRTGHQQDPPLEKEEHFESASEYQDMPGSLSGPHSSSQSSLVLDASSQLPGSEFLPPSQQMGPLPHADSTVGDHVLWASKVTGSGGEVGDASVGGVGGGGGFIRPTHHSSLTDPSQKVHKCS